MKKTTYEWSIETTDKHGDIVDNDFDEKLKLLLKRNPNRHCHPEEILVLVRTEWDADEDVADRTWAYETCNSLPDYFENGAAVPQRFHKELQRA